VTAPDRVHTLVAYGLLLALALSLLAYWAPWVHHAAAALRLSGQDLGEFVKFIPAIRRGELSFPRQLFYLPPLVATIVLVAISVNRQLPYRQWLRVAMLVFSVAVLPGVLPPAWGHPKELFVAEFRLQGIGLLLGAGVAAAHGLFRRLSLRTLALIVLALALPALAAPQAAFWAIRPRLWAAYDVSGLGLGRAQRDHRRPDPAR
jgi:hypothetical protein